MKRSLTALTLAGAVAIGGLAQPATALTEKEKARLAGAILGVAIASEIKKERRNNNYRYHRRSGHYLEGYKRGSPIYCFPNAKACYWRGRVEPYATYNEFGRR
ncbi:hypothetical protein AAFO92_05735 [Roseovarius sp. CAU 1744]|uniref:hypothetical protein n=1 Tax=Roseovarius sp. CAU 1744 TaxID=3140368 RepID=UPI00325A9040